MDPTDEQQRNRAGRAAVALFGLLLFLGNGHRLHAQTPTDAVERLRIVLLTTTDDDRLREQKLRECVDGLRGVGDLRRAVTLTEWKNDGNRAAVDGAQRSAVRSEERRGGKEC